MTLVTLPYRTELAAGQPEDIGMVLADLDAILAVVNGDLRNDNFSPTAGIPLSKMAITGTPDGTKYLRDDSSWAAPSGGEWILIGDSVLGAAGTFSFTSIPGTYRHLALFLYLRGAVAATSDHILIRFNNDTGNNYDSYTFSILGTSPTTSAQEHLAAAAMFLDNAATGNSATANVFSVHHVAIPHYANAANQKSLVALSGTKFGTSTGQQRITQSHGGWRSNVAVSRIDILGSAAANFQIGSRATLYGM